MAKTKKTKKMRNKKEKRNRSTDIELRELEEGKNRTIGGYALKYSQRSEILTDYWGDEFVEEFAAGAFDKSLKERNQKALWNHKSELPLGSVKSGTLRFNSDSTGLNYDIDLPNNSWGDDALESIKRGDVDGSSFAFTVIDDKWSEVEIEGRTILKRTVLEAEINEVSPCTFPAYSSSEIKMRSLKDYKNEKEKRKRLILLTKI
jgi:HK97 family phage prohead protease